MPEFRLFLSVMFTPNDTLYQAPDADLLPMLQGGFARRVLLLLVQEEESAPARAFLEKILGAVQLNLERDTLWAEISENSPVDVPAVVRKKQPDAVLVFGLSPQVCGLQADFSAYHPTHFYQTVFLFADRLSFIEREKDAKAKLWLALRQIFSI